jgi:methyl coenzyme M reductase alpha subunit
MSAMSAHNILIILPGAKTKIEEMQDASYAFIAAQGAKGLKRNDADASHDADIIIDAAKPIVEEQARKHLRNAVGKDTWQDRAALLKRALQLSRSVR